MKRKAIELLLITVAATMIFDFSLFTFLGVLIGFAAWEIGERIFLSLA